MVPTVSFDRDRCLEAFRRYNERTGTEIVTIAELEAKADGDLGLSSAGVIAALQARAPSGNGGHDPLPEPLADLLKALGANVGWGPQGYRVRDASSLDKGLRIPYSRRVRSPRKRRSRAFD
jgi:hypothetical protein